jgi:hypothetical protein
MAGPDMSQAAHGPAAGGAVVDYLAAVAAQLRGPAAARAVIIDELRDGLLEAAEAYQAQGCSAREAAAAAIAEFGDPATVAAGFGPELAATQARRVALGLLATGPLVGAAWIAAVAVNALPPWRQQLSGPWLALPLVGLALVVAWAALGLTVAASGRLGRRLGGWLGRAVLPSTAAAVAGLAAVLVDLTLLAIMGGHTLATAGSLASGPVVVVAAGASLARATLAGLAARRCLATRAALT